MAVDVTMMTTGTPDRSAALTVTPGTTLTMAVPRTVTMVLTALTVWFAPNQTIGPVTPLVAVVVTTTPARLIVPLITVVPFATVTDMVCDIPNQTGNPVTDTEA